MIPYPNKAQWRVIWGTVAFLWLYGIGMMREEYDRYSLAVVVIVTGLALLWRFSKRKGA